MTISIGGEVEKISVSIADMKRKFSEYVNRSAFSDCRVIITKRERPVAAMIGMSDLQTLEQAEKRNGLMSLIGKWEGFEEICEGIDEAVKARREESSGRDVSL